MSSVLFETAEIVPGLDLVARACRRVGVRLLVDAYHHLNVVSFEMGALGLEDAFVTGGGYKYCELGEGNCFLRVPQDAHLRPVLTGWFAEFAPREGMDLTAPAAGAVLYGRGADALAGATYDPTPHYRAAAVFDFFAEQRLTAERLQTINRAQVSLLERQIEALDLDPEKAAIVAIPPDRRGGFLALRVENAAPVVQALRARAVYADCRGNILRLGPAPYVSDDQLRDAALALGEVLRTAGPAGL
jgi:kynureninase